MHNAGNCTSARILIAALICDVFDLTASAQPAPSARSVDPNAEQRARALLAQLTADKAITVARERRIAEADREKLYEQLKVKDQALRLAEKPRDSSLPNTVTGILASLP